MTSGGRTRPIPTWRWPGPGRSTRRSPGPSRSRRTSAVCVVAAKYPDKVKEMDKLFWTEAAKYQVEPLDATVATRIVAPRPNLSAGRTEFIWSGEITGTPNGDAPSILDSSFNFKAEVN